MDDDQQFCLRWNNHQSTLVSVFDTLLEKGMHVDCTLAAEGQVLKAHKVVLSACSPYFESVLAQQFDKHPIIILKDVKYAELRAMMDYMYRGEVNISQDQLAALLKAAESLQIKGLSDNKPSRPPSRPAPPAAAPPLVPHAPHVPRAPSPPPQARDGSVDSREGSVSPTRRRKKPRRLSSEGVPPAHEQSNGEPSPPAGPPPPCKEEGTRDGVEDLTIDEEAESPPPHTHNDVVRNFQWHMERSQDEIMNSSDSVRDTQEPPLTLTGSLNYAKTPNPLTRGYITRGVLKSFVEKEGYLKSLVMNDEPTEKRRRGRPKGIKNKPKEPKDKPPHVIKRKYTRKRLDDATTVGEKRFVCSLCNKKKYKYRRNKLRHEKYECMSGPQFACGICAKRYSQKKTLISHIALKHNTGMPLPLEVKSEGE